MDKAIVANLNDVFQKQDDQGSYVGARLRRMVETAQRVERPPFPRQLQIETTNICNHHCSFCAYTAMERPKRHMDRSMFRRLVKEAYECGAREIGLFAGAEPLTSKLLEEHIAYCRELGYEYLYMSTNGALANEDRFRRLMDAGLSSVKFSVNGGNREVYRRVHGRDDFDKVIANIRFVSSYRRNLGRSFYLGVSFVGMPDTDASFEELKATVSELVDEVIYYEASNQSGQMPALPPPPYGDCALPFNKIHITREGYLRACCNDYENLLAIEDLTETGMAEAWHSERFRRFRRRHMEDRLDGTLCAKCIRRSTGACDALNPALVSPPPARTDRKAK